MKRNELQKLVYLIKQRKGYRNHIVLDGGNNVVLVTTKDSKIFLTKDINNLQSKVQWHELTKTEALNLGAKFWFEEAVANLLNKIEG